MRAWLLLLAVLLLPWGAGRAMADACGGRPPVDISRLPGVVPDASLPSSELHILNDKRTTCDYVILSLDGRVEYVSGAHALLLGPGRLLRLYDLRSQRAYDLDRGPVLSSRADGRWVVYAKYQLAEEQGLRYKWYSGVPVPAKVPPGARPNRAWIYALDLTTGQRKLLAASSLPGYSTTTLPQLDLSSGRVIYRVVRGDPLSPTSEVHLVDLRSGRDRVLRTYRWPRYVHEVAIDGNLVVWSLITAQETGKPSATARVYLYDLSTHRGKVISSSGRDWHPDLAAGRVAWIRTSDLESPGYLVLYQISSGRARVLRIGCPYGIDDNRCLASSPVVMGERVLSWHSYDGGQVQYDLVTGKIERLDKRGQMISSSADGLEESWSGAYSVGRGQSERVVYRSTILLYRGADARSLPRMPRTGGGGMARAEGY